MIVHDGAARQQNKLFTADLRDGTSVRRSFIARRLHSEQQLLNRIHDLLQAADSGHRHASLQTPRGALQPPVSALSAFLTRTDRARRRTSAHAQASEKPVQNFGPERLLEEPIPKPDSCARNDRRQELEDTLTLEEPQEVTRRPRRREDPRPSPRGPPAPATVKSTIPTASARTSLRCGNGAARP